MQRLIDDGTLFTPRPRLPPRFQYPFGNFTTPDNFTRIISRNMVVRPQYFQPITARRTSWTNLLLQSNTLNASPWALTTATVATDGTLAPDGAVAWKLTEDDTAAAAHFIEQGGVAITAGKVVRYVLAKAGARNLINLALIGNVSVAQGFDLATGETYPNGLGMSAPEGTIMFPISDGWFFCGMAQTFTSGLGVQTFLDDGTGVVYDGDGTSGVNLAYDHVLQASRFGPIFRTDGEARTISAPELEPGDEIRDYDPFALLVEETEPQPDSVGRYTWDRNFSRIPIQQVIPSFQSIPKPAVSGTFPQRLGAYVVRQNDPSIARYDGFLDFVVISDTGAPSFPVTGGTYTITFDGDTTGSLAYDADAATVETALNLLPSITARGGCTVSGVFSDPAGFVIAWNSYATCTVDMSSLSMSAGTPFDATSSINDGFTQIPQISAFPNNFLGGTWTITIFGQTTTALAWDALLTDVETALNTLSEVTARGGCTVTGDPFNGGKVINGANTVISCTVNFSNPPFTGDASSLLPAGAIITGTNFDVISPPHQNIKFQAPATRTIVTQTPHGMSADSRIYITAGSPAYFDVFPGTFTILDDVTVQMTIQATYPYASIGTITNTGRMTRAAYAPGTATVRVSKVRDFYLPGVTPGIATVNDIPVPAGQSENSAFLEAVFSGEGSLNWAVGNLEQWKGPIVSLEKTAIQVSDL